MPLYRISYTASFFLCRVKTAQPSQTLSRSQFSTCCCAVWKWTVFFTSLFFNAQWPPQKENERQQ